MKSIMLFQVPVETTTDPLPIIVGILVLGVIWLVIRTFLKLTMRIFMFGCVGILLLGALLVVMNYVSF
jgi:hypothetical protein